MLDIWPPLPIDLRVYDLDDLCEDNAIATLENNDRICEIYVQDSDKDSFERFAAAMQVPFPALTDLSRVVRFTITSCTRFVLGWIRLRSTIALLEWHCSSGFKQTTSVCH